MFSPASSAAGSSQGQRAAAGACVYSPGSWEATWGKPRASGEGVESQK